MVSTAVVRKIAMSLPGAYEQPSHGGQPSWRTKPRMFTWIRDDPEALVVWVESEEEKHALIAVRAEEVLDHAALRRLPDGAGRPGRRRPSTRPRS